VAWANRPAGHESDQTYVTVAARASDPDGYIAGFSIDWGDGTPAERYPGDPMGCRPSASGWPASSLAYLPSNPPPTHHYSSAGRHAITITATSTGCDGHDPQTAAGTETWDTTGPNQ
jgi:hypothetical protein